MTSPADLVEAIGSLSLRDLTRVVQWAHATAEHLQGDAAAPFEVMARLALDRHRAVMTDAAFLVDSAFDPIESGEIVESIGDVLDEARRDGWEPDSA